ncbi:MAG: HD domain-containing protein [archaeon]
MMDEEFFARLRKRVLPYFEIGDGHGFDHVERVYNLAMKISEGEDVDMDVVRAAVLLHDVARGKEKGGIALSSDEGNVCHAEEGARMAGVILKEMGFPEEKIGKVVHAVAVHRYSKGLRAETREAEVLQDADRLDALGATILVRMVQASVEWGVPIYDSGIPVKEVYDGSKSSVINHIYEKILKLRPEFFKTDKAKEIAWGRYDFVKEFAERYVKEVEGEL